MSELAKAHKENLERVQQLSQFTRTIGSVYTIALYIAFALIDALWYPEHLLIFIAIRAAVASVVFFNARLLRKELSLGWVQWIASISISSAGIGIFAMIVITGDPATPYWGGLCLTVIGLSTGFRLTWSYYIVNLSLQVLPFFAFGVLATGADVSNAFYLHSVFLLSLAVIGTLGRWFSERLYQREYLVRERLAEEVANRDQLVKQKSEEAIRLHSLSRQFSPQIIEAIKSGNLSIDGRVHRSEICAIFVDIKDSTTKFISLDRDDIQHVLSLFMDDVLTSFLKYDITIDKFMGDGILGFSNNPVQQADYIERCLQAALEINSRIELKSKRYSRYWLSEFEIRIGVATGYASVGFYGSNLHIKAYTAIGRVINLSNRVNSAGRANQVTISGDVLAKLEDSASPILDSVSIEPLGCPTMKGFENEKIQLYQISKKIVATTSAMNDEICPAGHGLLYLNQNSDGHYELRCRTCGYVAPSNSGRTGLPNAA